MPEPVKFASRKSLRPLRVRRSTSVLRPLRLRGQSTAEYAILFGVAIAAIVAMQLYVKRGQQGRMKMVTDTAVGAVVVTLGRTTEPKNLQYEPYYATSTYTVEKDSTRTEEMKTGGIVERTGISDTTRRTGSQDTAGAQ